MLPTPRSSTGASQAARFGTTQWSVVLQAEQGAEEALLKLCKLYWRPLYAFVRRRGHTVHEAQDLTQAFFAHVLEHRSLENVAPSKDRFRSFLLVSLRHFLDNEWHRSRAQKRGGGHVILSWNELRPEERDALEPRDNSTPEKAFNRRWALMLLERSMNQLRVECVAAGKGELFDRLKDCLTGDATGTPYHQLASDLNLSEGALKVTIHRLRRRFGELVRRHIATTVSRPEEIDEEIRELFSALS